MAIKDIELHGSDKEKASQFWEIIKTRKLSPKELEKLTPIATSFFQELTVVVKTQIESDEVGYKEYQTTMRSLLDMLSGCLKDGQIDKEERLAIIKLISDINHQMADVQKNKDDNSTGFKKFLAACVTVIVGIIVVAAGGNKTNKNS